MLSYIFLYNIKKYNFQILKCGRINQYQGVVKQIQIYKYISIFGNTTITNTILKEIKYDIKRDQIFIRK